VKKIYVFCQIEHNEYEIISFRIIIPNNNDISIIMKELRETIDNFEKTIQKIIGILNEVLFKKLKNIII
jgi:hypothetical protein